MTQYQYENETVISRVQKGDITAFEEVYHQYYHKIFNFVLKHVHSKQDTEEIVQDVFLKIWKSRETLDPNLSFNGLLFKVAKFTLLNYLRSQVKTYSFNMFTEQDLISTEQPEAQTFYNELVQITSQIIEELPPKRKMIYQLSRNEGLSHKEIAQKMNVSVKTVESQMRLALQFIRKQLKIHANVPLSLLFLIQLFF